MFLSWPLWQYLWSKVAEKENIIFPFFSRSCLDCCTCCSFFLRECAKILFQFKKSKYPEQVCSSAAVALKFYALWTVRTNNEQNGKNKTRRLWKIIWKLKIEKAIETRAEKLDGKNAKSLENYIDGHCAMAYWIECENGCGTIDVELISIHFTIVEGGPRYHCSISFFLVLALPISQRMMMTEPKFQTAHKIN